MLEALGVDTSKSFSLIETGEALHRSDEPSPTRSCVLVRLSHSHIRIGTFQRLAFLDDRAAIARLLDHAVAHYFPELADAPEQNRAGDFLERVTARVARQGARYMAAGFVHGVLNSDNINITGESFDYGPWRFAPRYDPQFTAAYFDESGLYAFGRQPGALGWNLTRLAETLLPLTGIERTEKILSNYQAVIRREFQLALLDRFALLPAAAPDGDASLAEALLTFLGKTRASFEQTFFDWRGGLASCERAARSPQAEAYETPEFVPLRAAFAERETTSSAALDHPYFHRETPCSMQIEEMEAIWTPIAVDDDWSAFADKLADIAAMRDAYGGAAQ
jgi:uncharacterized protein YdiU (UPF0061 family)